ncbi:hypothetical protein COLO4_00132 [Corchorus olitorius]|uniref:Uncharacterized protein n=1 Tax=Corchorus olitorius TaxID=93759 RepID=A0A1R3L4P5_9ROSI|nr:hypothetical protein COLO4_00132 [Corchorus olitorius]
MNEQTRSAQQASTEANGESAQIAVSGEFVFSGFEANPQTMSTSFNISASASSIPSMPANVSTQVSASAPSPPAPASTSGPASASAPHHATVQKKKAKPLPKILTMPPRTGEFSILDEAGNFHGLKRGRSSPASIAKLMKKGPTVAENRSGDSSQFSKAPVRRSPRNLTKTNVASGKELKGKKKLF